ncbi:MAG TPA: asparaginase [Gemmatimonadales bacterium]|nr:asparaginase [Gemmatimonadales bacterium]
MIHLLFTGGTISMRRDAVAGGNMPAHGGAALVAFAPGLERIAPFRVEDWARVPACHMGPDRLWALRERVRELVEGPDPAAAERPNGVVVTHGTDILEETAYLLARTLDPAVPVAVTGAMRTSSDEAWDGPRNLTDAAAVAASPASAGRGAMVVFAGRIFAGREAVKVDTMALEAFAAPHGAPLGTVVEGAVRYAAQPDTRRSGGVLRPKALRARVALLPLVIGDDGALLDLARPGHDGVVIVAFGSGNMPPGAVPAMRRWLDEGKPVVLSSRCPRGVVTPAYAFDGGGAQLVRLGAIPAGPRTPSQARMELTIALSARAPYGSD